MQAKCVLILMMPMKKIYSFQRPLNPADSSDQTKYVNFIFRLGPIMIRLPHARGFYGLTRVRSPQP